LLAINALKLWFDKKNFLLHIWLESLQIFLLGQAIDLKEVSIPFKAKRKICLDFDFEELANLKILNQIIIII